MWIGRIIGAFPCGELRIRLSQKLRIALQSQILGIICISQIENKAALVHMGKSILGHPACTVFVMLDVLRLGDAQMTVNIKRFARIDQFFKILAAAIGLKQKPSIRKALATFREAAKQLNANRQKTKHKDREVSL